MDKNQIMFISLLSVITSLLAFRVGGLITINQEHNTPVFTKGDCSDMYYEWVDYVDKIGKRSIFFHDYILLEESKND